MLSVRRSTTIVFDNAEKLVQHSVLVERFLLDELALLSLYITFYKAQSCTDHFRRGDLRILFLPSQLLPPSLYSSLYLALC